MFHIIIHPAWGYAYSTLDKSTILQKYKERYQDYCDNYVKEQDTVLLFTPFLDKKNKIGILQSEVPKILKKSNIEIPQINKKIFDLIVDDLHTRNNNNFKQSIKFFESIHKQNSLREKLYDRLFEYSNFVPLFNSCLLHSQDVKDIVDVIVHSLHNKNINFLSFNSGQLSLVHEQIDKIFNTLDGGVDVQIIGDWYNECIYSVTYQINQIAENRPNLNVNTNVIKEFCSFNNTQNGLKKHLIHSKNDMTFLSVSI